MTKNMYKILFSKLYTCKMSKIEASAEERSKLNIFFSLLLKLDHQVIDYYNILYTNGKKKLCKNNIV